VLLHEQSQKGLAIEQIVLFVKNQTAIEDKTTAYICENYICNRPINKIDDFDRMLSDIARTK